MKFEINKIKLIQGQEDQFCLFLLDENKESFQIHGATAIVMRVKNADGSILEKPPYNGWSWGIGNSCWAYVWQLTGDEIKALPLAADIDVELKITFGSTCKHLILSKCLSVSKLPF